MSTNRFPLIFLVGGLAIKALLVGLTKLVDSPDLVSLLTKYDPGAFTFANWGASLFFHPKRIAPGPGEAQIFEILLVVGFGVECLMIGFLARWFLRRGQGQHTARTAAR